MKFVILGDSGTGKTTLFQRLKETPDLSFLLWDFSDKGQFSEEEEEILRDCDVILLVFDLSSTASFDSISSRWLPLLRSRMKERAPFLSPWKYILLGNKSDKLEKEKVSFRSASQLANLLDSEFMEISAITSEQYSLEKILRNFITEISPSSSSSSPPTSFACCYYWPSNSSSSMHV